LYNGDTNINVHAIDDNYLKTELYRAGELSPFKTYTGAWFGLFWLPDGNYRMIVIDQAGNSSEYIFTIDKTAPDAPKLISPTNNSYVNGATLLSDWTDVVDVDHYVYESYHNQGASSLRWHAEYDESQKMANNVAESTFWWRVKAVDAAGNESVWSDLWKVTIDNTAPTQPVDLKFINPNLACGAITNIGNITVDWADS
jgi:hypothetical protein